jgi:hypothetical protein
MANFGPEPIKWSFVSTNDLSAKQFFFVKLSANNTVVLCAAVTDIPIGILQNKPTAGQTAEVVISGITKVVCAASSAAGVQIGTDGAGKAAIYAAGTDTTKYIAGVVLDGVTAANGIATVAIDCTNLNRGA